MGALCGKAEDDEEDYEGDGAGERRCTTVGMLAQALAASGLANAVAHLDVNDAEEQIRIAKAQMRTVTIRNGCLYIDYELIGRVSDNVNVQAY